MEATAGLGGMFSFDMGNVKDSYHPSKPAFWATAIFLLALGYLVFQHFKLIRG